MTFGLVKLGWLGGHCFVLPALPAASSTRAAPDRGGVAGPVSLGREGIPRELAAHVLEFYAGGHDNRHGEADQLVLSLLRFRPLAVRADDHLGGGPADKFRDMEPPWPSTLCSRSERASRGDRALRPDGAGARALLLVSLSCQPNPALHLTGPA